MQDLILKIPLNTDGVPLLQHTYTMPGLMEHWTYSATTVTITAVNWREALTFSFKYLPPCLFATVHSKSSST